VLGHTLTEDRLIVGLNSSFQEIYLHTVIFSRTVLKMEINVNVFAEKEV
jgi:hypothetical protein